MSDYAFTTDWFSSVKPLWDRMIPHYKPATVLEIGSFEGPSACYLIQTLGKTQALEMHCVDTWEGGLEHRASNTPMDAVEARFTQNIRKAIDEAAHKATVIVHKQRSDLCLAKLLTEGKLNYFDFIYIDGSHQAADVLYDAVAAFRLLKVGGIMGFDDYLWYEQFPEGKDLQRCPKPAIDAFVNLYFNKLDVMKAPVEQFYVMKRSD